MKLERVTGDYREIGKRLGSVQKQSGRGFQEVSNAKHEFALECSKAVATHAPGLLDEIEAVIGMHRKAIIRLLNGRLSRKNRSYERGRAYGVDVDDQ